MTVDSTQNNISHTGNGVATEFSFPFRIFEDSDLVVTQVDDELEETVLVLDDDYTVDGAGDYDGGSVTLLAGALADGYTLVIKRSLDALQETNFGNLGSFLPEEHEKAFDRLTMLVQELKQRVDVIASISEALQAAGDFDPTFPNDVNDPANAGRAIVVNSTGTGLTLGDAPDADPESLEETESLSNNVAVATNIPTLLFDSADFRSAIVEYDIKRKTSTDELRSVGRFFLVFRALTNVWELAGDEFSGDDHGIEFSVTAGGQVQYVSSNVSGASYSGVMKYKLRTFNA